MLLQNHSLCYFSTTTTKSHLLRSLRRRRRSKKASTNTIVCLSYGMDAVSQIAHNKVLIAAAVSAAVGQLTKPLSAAILYRQSFNIKAVFQAGGFPSTHSSGVRREVGTHAKALNRMLRSRSHMNLSSSSNGDSLADTSSENSSSKLESPNPFLLKEPSKFRSKSNGSSVLLRSDSRMNQSTSVLISSSSLGDGDGDGDGDGGGGGGGGGDDDDDEGGLGNGAQYSYLLKESVGHTEIEVIAGALLGFCISLAVYYSV